MRIEQHLVTLARIRHQPERPARAQLHVRDLQPVVDASHRQTFFAPVELEGLAQLERQRHEGVRQDGLAGSLSPGSREVSHAAVAAGVARGLDLYIQRPRRAPLLPRPLRVRREGPPDRLLEGVEFAPLLASLVLRLLAQRARAATWRWCFSTAL